MSIFFYGIIIVYNILIPQNLRTLTDSHILRELLRISGSNSIKLNAITHLCIYSHTSYIIIAPTSTVFYMRLIESGNKSRTLFWH